MRRIAILSSFALVSVATLSLALFGRRFIALDQLFVRGTYWFLLASFCLLASTAVGPLRRASRSQLALIAATVLGAIALTALCFWVAPPRYRVLADETNLLSTSLSLHIDHSLHNIVELLRTTRDQLRIVGEGVATRPALFPFLLSLLHTAFGYHAGFGFLLNFLVGAATLALIVLLGRELAGWTYGLLAGALLASFPLYVLVVSSAGFDALNLCLFMAVLLCVIRFAKEPTAPRVERLLILAAIASQCRYESPVVAVALLAPLLMRGRHLVLQGRFSPRLVIIPVLYLPPLLHAVVLGVNGAQTNAQPELRHRAAFAGEYLWANLRHALDLFTDVKGHHYPIARFTFVCALVGVALMVARLRRPSFRQNHLPVLLFASIAMFLFAAIHMSFAMGDLTTAYNARLATIYLGPLALLAAYPIHRVWQQVSSPRPTAWFVAATAAALLIVYLPVARDNRLIGALSLSREYQRNLEILRRWPGERLVVVAERAGMYVAQGAGAVYPRHLAAHWTELRDDARRQSREIVVIQHVDTRTGLVTPAVPPDVALAVIEEYPLNGQRSVRLSRALIDATPGAATQLAQVHQ